MDAPARPSRKQWARYGLLITMLLPAACAPAGPSLVGVKPRAVGQYIIGPGDALDVFVYRAPDLSATVPVRPDGRVSTPLVSDVRAAGRTPTELASAIEARLRKYVKRPNVTVMVTDFIGPRNRQIRVIGEVAQPLEIPYTKGLTLLDVMIAAKGLTRFAAGNRALIVRQEPGGPETFGVKLDNLLEDGDISQNVAMRPGDTLFVPEAWF